MTFNRPPLATKIAKPRMLLGLSEWDDRLLSGIERFARLNGWELDYCMQNARFLRNLSLWDGEGIISQFGPSDELNPLKELLANRDVPSVCLGCAQEMVSSASVSIDYRRIGALGAEHLCATGVERLMVVEAGDGSSHRAIANGFIEWCRQNGLTAERKNIGGFGVERVWSSCIGVMVTSDVEALYVARQCRASGLAIPNDVRVLGVGNNEALCEFAETPVSSVDCNLDELGFRVAATLQAALNGEGEQGTTLVEPSEVVCRESTIVRSLVGRLSFQLSR